MPLSQLERVETNVRRLAQRFDDLPVTEVVLARALIILARDINTLLENALKPYGLSETEGRLLMALFSHGGSAFAGDVCGALAQSPANLTRISDTLVERGFISRSPDLADRRACCWPCSRRREAGANADPGRQPADRRGLCGFQRRRQGAAAAEPQARARQHRRAERQRRGGARGIHMSAVRWARHRLPWRACCRWRSPPVRRCIRRRAPRSKLRQSAPVIASPAPAQGAWPQAQWWKSYDDPTLERLVEAAIGTGPTIAAADARIRAAEEQVRVAGAALGLSVDAHAGYTRQRLSDNGMIPPSFLGFHWYDQSDLGVAVRYQFDWWGKQRAAMESAIDHARATAAERQAATLALASAVSEAYFAWQADSAHITLQEQAVSLRERQLALARARAVR